MEEKLTWLRATIEVDMAKAKAVLMPKDQWYSPRDLFEEAPCVDWDEAQVLALYSPGAVIARCEAELKLLDKLLPELELADDAINSEWGDSPELAETLIKTLLESYRHREGFKPEWVNA